MSLPLYDGGLAAGLLCGILFGYVLEGAGFGSPTKLTAQFELSDWSVFKVMFTAVIVAAFGLWLAQALGVLRPGGVFVPTLFFWATLGGGLLIGAGFALGGYCPGTSAVGLASGRGDALVFILGMVAGTVVFAALYPLLAGLVTAAAGPQGQTLSALLGLPDWLVIALLALVAAGGWRLGSRLERRLGGPVTAEQALAAEAGTPPPRPAARPHRPFAA
ncbi:hypothetical protein SAMN06265365_1364 [Tistlia consotensis]|uniref:Uncharacterized protein n=1 Tax=Tistlia consotensis USBA 355 TaxID=560819 RepID=A0A1Y6CMM8_9PROT|nr:DUF6691 family protein [Tistlia consotensis]SMF78090.1 hypothetical protein SAMN05428998_1385 [Tistlia consotensis USBA 355]SNS17750.1 hypothetical protein SAMN06265365_1364 [Tistlia consotensis]